MPVRVLSLPPVAAVVLCIAENRLLEILPDGGKTDPVTIPLKTPFDEAFTATPRGGSAPSTTLDLPGTSPGVANAIRYARVKLRW